MLRLVYWMWHIGRGLQQDTTCDMMSHVSHLGMLGRICPARSASRTPRRRMKVPLPLVDSTCKQMLYLTSIRFSACFRNASGSSSKKRTMLMQKQLANSHSSIWYSEPAESSEGQSSWHLSHQCLPTCHATDVCRSSRPGANIRSGNCIALGAKWTVWAPDCHGTTRAGRCLVTKIFTTAAPTWWAFHCVSSFSKRVVICCNML